ncbi:MAG: ATP-dependent Clp protease proteolytic subunit [Anaerolineae bacterium]
MSKKKTTYINLFAGIDAKSVTALMQAVQQKLQQGTERFVLLISSPGGQVGPGLSAYNFLKGIPARVDTHNYGSVDSVAIAVFCAGKKRLCVPNARFMLHGVGFNVPQGARFEEKQLDERMKSLRVDRQNIARVIAENCSKPVEAIDRDMLEVKVLGPSEAQTYGLVHEIKAQLYPKGADILLIGTS